MRGVSRPESSRCRGHRGRRAKGRLPTFTVDGLAPAVPDLLPRDVPTPGASVRAGCPDVPMGIRAADAGEARTRGLLPTHRGRVSSRHLRDLGTGAPKRVPSAAASRFRDRVPRAEATPLPPVGSRALRRGRGGPVRPPPEDGGKWPPPRMEAVRAIARGPRTG